MNKTISVLDTYQNKSTTMPKGESALTKKIKLSLFRWIQLKITGHTFYRNTKLKRWSAPMPFFISYCQACRHYFITHPHGWAQNLYACPTCEAKLGYRPKIRNLRLGVNFTPQIQILNETIEENCPNFVSGRRELARESSAL